jgi:hypothetical protein
VPRVVRAASSPREGEADVVPPHAHMKGFQLTTVGPTIGRETSRHSLRAICIGGERLPTCLSLNRSSPVDRTGHKHRLHASKEMATSKQALNWCTVTSTIQLNMCNDQPLRPSLVARLNKYLQPHVRPNHLLLRDALSPVTISVAARKSSTATKYQDQPQ